MKELKDFKKFVEEGIVKKQEPNRNRANDLMEESDKNYNFLKKVLDKVDIIDEDANSIIKNSYDIIMPLIRSKMLLKGFSSSGIGAHEAEVAYLKVLGFLESDVEFCNQLRYFRNGIMYYGKKFDKEYAEKVLNFLEKVKKNLEK